jgi:hypothetical protein
MQGFLEGTKLFCSPFIGAWDEMNNAVRRPSATNWRELVRNDIRIFMAPMAGAMRGFTHTFYNIWNSDEIKKP